MESIRRSSDNYVSFSFGRKAVDRKSDMVERDRKRERNES